MALGKMKFIDFFFKGRAVHIAMYGDEKVVGKAVYRGLNVSE